MELRIKVVCTSLCRSDITAWQSQIGSPNSSPWIGLLAQLLSTFWPPLTVEKPLLAPEILPETSEVVYFA
ncbi:unnamed protein product [Ilex paraguariensis]|uniref:Alcohol dehydrogenase n=1 Tax=Ilex paraguariensis TaxID=185542 RepID=A0ABC8SK20_9AQUA